ncbi:MAG: non-homologous end-joining DNA ligase, partial [Actinomycetota bacterium]
MSPASDARRREVRVGRRTVALSSPDKVLFPDDGITKGELFEYYLQVGSTMLPHVRGRPVTMERFPDGLGGERFYQKEARFQPPWLDTAVLPKEKGSVRHVVVNEVAALAYLAQQNSITAHVWLSRADRPVHPDRMAFDLDPPDDEHFAVVRRTAFALRDLLDELGLPSFLKTSGAKGLHVLVPLVRGPATDEVHGLADRIGSELVRRDPKRLTMEGRIAKREGRLFVDTWRNGYAQMVVAPYAVRGRPGATVSTPIAWEEAEDSRLRPARFHLRNVPERLASVGDPWRGMGRNARALTEPAARLAGMEAARDEGASTDATDRWGHR